MRQGMADYLCLHLLREEIDRAERSNSKRKQQEARLAKTLIGEAVGEVLGFPNDSTLAGLYRERIVKQIVELRK